MAEKKSTRKKQKESFKKRLHNLFYKNKIKNLSKRIKILIEKENIEKAKELLPEFYSVLDKAVKEKVIKRGTRDRKKSKLTKLIRNKLLSLKEK